MKIEAQDALIEISVAELGPPGTPGDDDLLLKITARVSGYSASDQAWVTGNDWQEFLAEFCALEEKRQGKAALAGASPDDLMLEFLSTDSQGHMAVRGHIGWNNPSGYLLQLRFGFDLEPDRLPTILKEFQKLKR